MNKTLESVWHCLNKQPAQIDAQGKYIPECSSAYWIIKYLYTKLELCSVEAQELGLFSQGHKLEYLQCIIKNV